MTPQTALHLIERNQDFQVIDKATHVYESHCWKLSKEATESLVGGFVYFHQFQDKRSYYGGKILGFRELGEVENGRYAILFQALPEGRGRITSREGWGREKKIVLGDNNVL